MSHEIGVLIGATGGIGRACLSALDGLASHSIAVARTKPVGDLTQPSVTWVDADITTDVGRGAIVSAIRHASGRIRYVVFASGIPFRGAIAESTETDWVRTFAANVIGPGLLLGDLLDLSWTKPASVVFVGSLSSRRVLPRRAVYGASKAALEHFAATAAVELAGRRISVNVASLGVTATPFIEGDAKSLAGYLRRSVPAGRVIQPSEAARLVRFLVEAPDVLTGSVVAMDGGASAPS